MCLGIPGRVVELAEPGDGRATVDLLGTRRAVSCQLLADDREPLAPGDWVLVHMGFAVERIDPADADELLGYLEARASELPGGGAGVAP